MKLEWVPDAVAPHVKRLAAAIGAHINVVMTEAIDRAIAALAPPASQPEVTHADSDRRDHDPLPDLRGGAGRGLRTQEPVRRDIDASPGGSHAPDPSAAQTQDPRREDSQLSPRLVIPEDLIEQQLGPDIAKMLQPGKPIGPPPLRLRPKKEALEAAQTRARERIERVAAHAPPPEAAAVSPFASQRAAEAYSLAAAKARIAERSKARHLQRKTKFAAARAKPDLNPNAGERWSSAQIAEETELAERRKPDIFELPAPSSSWEF